MYLKLEELPARFQVAPPSSLLKTPPPPAADEEPRISPVPA